MISNPQSAIRNSPSRKFASRAALEAKAARLGPEYLTECVARGRYCPTHNGWYFTPDVHAFIRARWTQSAIRNTPATLLQPH